MPQGQNPQVFLALGHTLTYGTVPSRGACGLIAERRPMPRSRFHEISGMGGRQGRPIKLILVAAGTPGKVYRFRGVNPPAMSALNPPKSVYVWLRPGLGYWRRGALAAGRTGGGGG